MFSLPKKTLIVAGSLYEPDRVDCVSLTWINNGFDALRRSAVKVAFVLAVLDELAFRDVLLHSLAAYEHVLFAV